MFWLQTFLTWVLENLVICKSPWQIRFIWPRGSSWIEDNFWLSFLDQRQLFTFYSVTLKIYFHEILSKLAMGEKMGSKMTSNGLKWIFKVCFIMYFTLSWKPPTPHPNMDKSIYFLFVFEPFPYTDRGFLLALSSINSQLWFKAQFRIRKTTIVVLLQYFVIFCQIFFYATASCGYEKPQLWNFLKI